MPGFNCHAQLKLDIVRLYGTILGEAKLKKRGKPFQLKSIARLLQLADDLPEILPYVVRQGEPVMQFRSPACQLVSIRSLPETGDQRTQQQHLHLAHPHMGWHLEGAHLEQSQASADALR